MYIKKEDQAATVRQTVMGGKGEILSRIFLDSKDAAGARRKSWTRGRSTSCMPAI